MNDKSKQTKLNQLISSWPKGTLKTVKELEARGYTPQLLKVYTNSNWIELFMRGMYKLYNDKVNWQGALYAIQQRTSTTLHAGGKTALAIKGYGHYISQKESNVFLFSARNESIQNWVKKFEEIRIFKNEIFDYTKEESFTVREDGIHIVFTFNDITYRRF